MAHWVNTSRRYYTTHLALGAGCILLLAGAVPLGTEIRKDGYSLRPPGGFLLARMELFRDTKSGAPTLPATSSRALSVALVDRPGEDSASMLISVVDGTFQATPAGRDELSTAVMRHFTDEIRLPMALDRAELITTAAPRVEVLGTVRQEGQLRNVLVAGMAGKGKHAVIIFSAPSGRWADLSPQIRASLDTFKNDPPAGNGISRGVAGAAALAGALIAALTVWRHRRRERVF